MARDTGRHDVVGRRLPEATGRALSGEEVLLPRDLGNGVSVILVAYRRGTQADIDRWRDALEREAAGVRVVEVPVIPAVVWRPLSGWIDGGMRGGVPRRLWPDVVTVYATGDRLRDFFGDDGGENAIVAAIDGDGVVRWCAAAGYTPAAARELVAILTGLRGSPRPAGGDGGRPPDDGRSGTPAG